MVLAGIKVIDSRMVHDAIELARSSSEPYLFNHAMRSWLFGVLLAEGAKPAPDPELLAVSAILHDLGLTDRYSALERFEVDGANAAGSFLKERGIPAHQIQLVWDAIALHTTRSIALHKEPEVAMTHSGIFVDVIGAGLELILPGLPLRCRSPEAGHQLRQLPPGSRYAVCGGLHSSKRCRSLRKCTFSRIRG